MKGIISLIFSALLMVGYAHAGTMNLATFQKLGNESVNSQRCVGGISTRECHEELDYAKAKKLIDEAAYQWGKSKGFYPVVDRRDEIKAVCKCGCFEASTLISTVEEGDIAIKSLSTKHSVAALNETASLSNISLTPMNVSLVTKGKEATPLYVFSMSNGTVLKLTQHHGVLLADGRMISAKEVTLKDQMLTADGQTVNVVGIERAMTKDDVYNFETSGFSKNHHIVVAEGILVGDVVWQNQFAAELGSILLRQ